MNALKIVHVDNELVFCPKCKRALKWDGITWSVNCLLCNLVLEVPDGEEDGK